MPIIKSAKKALRVSRRKEARNASQKKALAKALRGANGENINEVISIIDKAAKKNIIHKNKAARLKSRLAKKIGKTPQAKPASKKLKVEGRKSKSKVK